MFDTKFLYYLIRFKFDNNPLGLIGVDINTIELFYI